jgi:hypothetical protein
MYAKAEGFDNIYAFGPKEAIKGMLARAMNSVCSLSQYHSQLLSYIPHLLYAILYATPLCYYSDPLMLHYSVYLNTIILVQ